jgi:3D (Asp-Asp-Asp) domain-containing protein
MNRLILSALLSLAGTISLTTQAAVAPEQPRLTEPADDADRALSFMLPAPGPKAIAHKQKLWATWYYMPTVTPAVLTAFAHPFVDKTGEAISAPLKAADWCNAALQGSVWVETPDGKSTAYVYIDSNGPEQTDCDAQLGDLSEGVKAATRRARFASFTHPAGCDVRKYPLQPFRTVAVDPKRFKMGTVLYAPALRGTIFKLRGEVYIHDGYLVASDRGGAIEGNHIDVFVESDDDRGDPLPSIVRSSNKGAFDAYVVDRMDPVIAAIRESEQRTCDRPAPRKSVFDVVPVQGA